jgi:outer membrane protein OmpA-like peptidoglycan-associated protein
LNKAAELAQRFASDSDAIARHVEHTLSQMAQLLVDDPGGVVTIEGHADSMGSNKSTTSIFSCIVPVQRRNG